MSRLLSLSIGTALVVLAVTAHAEPVAQKTFSDFPNGTWLGEGRLKMVVTPPEWFRSSPPFEVSNVLYLNRCSGGCMVTGTDNINDARQHISSYIAPGPHLVSEYKNNAGEIGPAADAEWNAVVQCIKEIYSPFNVVVQDTPPTGTGNYTEAIIAGTSEDVGLSSMQVGGVAPAHNSCEPNDNAMSYTFANNSYYFGSTQGRVWQICAVAGQESAHHYGLDHSYEFYDGTSACNDPMTYRSDCGGQKFFRNKAAKCGESAVRTCFCGGLQNTHAKILSVFGVGPNTALIPPPTATINLPAPNAVATEGQVVAFTAGSKRGVEHSELMLNGWKWGDVKGAAFGANGQLNPSPYSTKFPAGVPNGVIDIQIKAYDDLGVSTLSPTVTVTKGAPCTSADSCAKGQKCEAGKCFWEQPTGQLGDACDYNEFCTSNLCVETDKGAYCSQDCILGATAACADGFECVANGSSGACIPTDPGGCCSASGPDAVWVHGGLSLGLLGLVLRRRRRRRDRL
ncbi:MAG TPA: hypothetical protein VIV40_10715 [Kofleriaceae bacterium]